MDPKFYLTKSSSVYSGQQEHPQIQVNHHKKWHCFMTITHLRLYCPIMP